APVDVLLLFKIVPAPGAGNPRVSITFGGQDGGSDFALGADLQIARRKNGEVTKVLQGAAKTLAGQVPTGKDLGLRLRVGGGTVHFELSRGEAEPKTASNVRLADEDAAGFLGFEVQDAKVVIQDLSIRAEPDPGWLVEKMKA